MDYQKVLFIISSLSEGVDPYTGEILPDESPYQNPDTIRALFISLKALEDNIGKEKHMKKLPDKAGSPWSKEEDIQLVKSFDDGLSINDLANKHQRTYGAIRSRLTKLGKLIEDYHNPE